MKEFPFTYNSVNNANPPPGNDIDQFMSIQTITVYFQVHSFNFWIPKDLEAKFEYIFQMISFYLVQPIKRHDFLMPSRRKRGPDN